MISKLVLSGCSFTTGSSDMIAARKNPSTWGDFLLDKINPRVYLNLGIPGAGNQAITQNVVYCLESKKTLLDPATTLVGLNFSGLDRIDTMCDVDHPNANDNFSWARDFGFGWLTEGSFINKRSPYFGSLQKNIGYKSTVTTSCLSIVQGINYLKNQQYKFFFMLMNNQIFNDAPEWFCDFLNNHQEHWVRFGSTIGMQEFTRQHGQIGQDLFHPTVQGYQLIADEVDRAIKHMIN